MNSTKSCIYRENHLYLEATRLANLAEEFGTPLYVYSEQVLTELFLEYQNSFGQKTHLICFAVKANSNIAILNLLAKLGSGFDIVSGGELQRVMAAGGDPKKVVFSGIGKTEEEIKYALEVGIYCFNVESPSELKRIENISKSMGRKANVSFRVNPDVDAKTHPYISTGLKENKFGIPWHDAIEIYKTAHSSKFVSVCGIDCHIGSQMVDKEPFIDSVRRIMKLSDDLQKIGIIISHFDFGGGLGIRYEKEKPPPPKDWVKSLLEVFDKKNSKIILEPGRSIAGPAGILLTKVEYIKRGEEKNFLVVDAAMNDLLRPALYSSYHPILELEKRNNVEEAHYDVVGPVCETGDFLGKNRKLAVKAGDFLAILGTGAYTMSMASNYNSRGRAPEILVSGKKSTLIKPRESIKALFEQEIIPSDQM